MRKTFVFIDVFRLFRIICRNFVKLADHSDEILFFYFQHSFNAGKIEVRNAEIFVGVENQARNFRLAVEKFHIVQKHRSRRSRNDEIDEKRSHSRYRSGCPERDDKKKRVVYGTGFDEMNHSENKYNSEKPLYYFRQNPDSERCRRTARTFKKI